MSEQRNDEIRARAVQMARRHVHAGQATEQERKAAQAVLHSEGLTNDEAAVFWSAYDAEERETKRAMQLADDDWRMCGERTAEWMLDEGRLGVRDKRAPGPSTAEKISTALHEGESWPRLPLRRQVEVEALALDAAVAYLWGRAKVSPLWTDLGRLIRESDDGGEVDRRELVRAARVAGAAVLELGNPSWSTAAAALKDVGSDKPLFGHRIQLQYEMPVRAGTPERAAAEFAADALCAMLRAAEDGDLSVQVPAAWEKADKAIRIAFDGYAQSRRINSLRLNILATLPEHYLDGLGIGEDDRKVLRASAAQRRSA